jgi:hypothetical protein
MKPYTLEVSNLPEYECCECLAIEGEGTMILQNIRNCSLQGHSIMSQTSILSSNTVIPKPFTACTFSPLM